MDKRMRFISGVSASVDAQSGVEEVCQQIVGEFEGRTCHLVCVFFSTIYQTDWASRIAQIHERLSPQVLIGCSAGGIIGGEQELEWVPGVSIVAAHLPGVRLFPFAVSSDEVELASPGGFWVDKIGASPEAHPFFVLFADPYTCEPAKLIRQLNETYRTRPIVGGLLSGGDKSGEHLLFNGREVMHEGAVGVGMTGNITMDTIVSQGCRPVGRPYTVTKVEDNILWEVGGRSSIQALHEVLASISPKDRELAQRGSIFVGLVVNEMQKAFGSGDFLIRNIVGIDPNAGAIAISDNLGVGQTIQFQIRDAGTSRDELRKLLARWGEADQSSAPAAGALLFNCTGRGKALYGSPNHDVKTIQTMAGKLPLGGFFCSGEIGPIGGINFLHGYTASLGLFRPLVITGSAAS